MSAADPWIGEFSACRSAFSRSVAVRRAQVGERPAPAEDRRRVPVDPRLLDDAAQVVPHPAEPGEVVRHQLLRLAGLDPQLLAEPERGQAVGEAVRHRLDLGAHLRGHVGRVDAEDPRADEAVQVLPRVERLDQPGIAAEVRHDPHLDLRVVRGEQRLVAGAVLEGGADLAALLRLDRHVLQVRVVGCDPAGGRPGLLVGGVHAAVAGDRLVDGVDDLLELRRIPVLRAAGRGTDAGSAPAGRPATARRSSSRSCSSGSSACRAGRTAPPAAASASRGSARGRRSRTPPARARWPARRGRSTASASWRG